MIFSNIIIAYIDGKTDGKKISGGATNGKGKRREAHLGRGLLQKLLKDLNHYSQGKIESHRWADVLMCGY